MRYQIVYKTEEYRDKVIEAIGCAENILKRNDYGSETVVYSNGNYFRFIRCDMNDDSVRGQRFHHIILEKGCYDLMTEYQLMLV